MYLLLLSDKRAPCATGIAWLKDDGSHKDLRRLMSALDFVKERTFGDVMGEVDDNTTWLSGCIIDDIGYAQPICIGDIIGTADVLSQCGDFDPGIVFRMANDTLDNGRIDIAAFQERLGSCNGQISVIMASRLDPNTIVIKGNMLLEFRYHPDYNVIMYSSDPAYLDIALPREVGWQEIGSKPMSIMTFQCDVFPNFDMKLDYERR